MAWKANDQSWMHERRDWQVVLGRSVKVLPEDVPESVAQTLPGIAYLTELNPSPIDAPETARKFLIAFGCRYCKGNPRRSS
jgi:hypothetical protein